MSIVNDIEQIVANKYPSATYYFNSDLKANLNTNDLESFTIDNPLIVLYNNIPKDKEIQPNLNVLGNSEIRIRVLVKGSFDDNDGHMNDDVEACEEIADELMMQIYLLDSVRLLENEKQRYRIQPLFKVWSSILNGVEASGRYKINQTVNACSRFTVTADSNTVTADSNTVDASGGYI